jgi:hypothetical protein
VDQIKSAGGRYGFDVISEVPQLTEDPIASQGSLSEIRSTNEPKVTKADEALYAAGTSSG